jgi:hypothetical protein
MSKAEASYSTLIWTNSACTEKSTVLDKLALIRNNSKRSTNKAHESLNMFMSSVISITYVNPIKHDMGLLIKTLNETKTAKATTPAGGS